MRDIQKAIDDYKKEFCKDGTNRGKFFSTDIQQVIDMSTDVFDLVCNGLNAGFMIGYRLGKKEGSKRPAAPAAKI